MSGLSVADLRKLSSELFPIMRSIAGPGLRESLKILSQTMPMQIREIPSGTRVFDWRVPNEWIFESASIQNSRGETILDSSDNNLHVLNYSEPIKRTIKGAQLKKHLFFDPDRPDVIPYRTSYYEKNWGFCSTAEVYESILDSDDYHVAIQCSKDRGSMSVGEAKLGGSESREIVFSTYLCHPQMAINELSGPLTLVSLYRQLAETNLRYSYRFFVGSETIGALALLSSELPQLRRDMVGGAAVQMTGLRSEIVHREPRVRTEFDSAVELARKERAARQAEGVDFSPLPWSPIGGGDQRQWTANRVELPMSYISRTIRGGYPEYHTSADNLQLIDLEKVNETAAVLARACGILESNQVYNYIGPPGEPMLSRRGLLPGIGGPRAGPVNESKKVVLACSNGETSLISLASNFNLPFHLIRESATELEDAGLIEKTPARSPASR